MEMLFLGAGAALVGLVVGLILATTGRRLVVLLSIGTATAFALVIASYLSATPSSEPADCHDCIDFLGRWWEPALTMLLLVFNLVGWAAGLTAGAFFRGTFSPRRKAME